MISNQTYLVYWKHCCEDSQIPLVNKGTSLARGTQIHLEPRGDVPLTCDTGTTSPSHWRVHIRPRVHIRLCSPRGGTNTRSGTGTGLSRSESALSLRESNGPVDESPKADLRTLGLRSPDRPVAVLPGDEQRDQLEGTRRRQEPENLSLNYLAHSTLAGTLKGNRTRDQSHNPESCLTGRVRPTWGVLTPAEARTRCLKAPGRLTGLLSFPRRTSGPPGAVCL